ncbi:MAG: cupin domain-containing protein [Gemmatimonadaceae bacterium]
MKKFLIVLIVILLVVAGISYRVVRGSARDKGSKSRIVAVNTTEIEGLPIDSGKLKFIASSEDTNGAFAIVERTQDPCYKTTWHRHDNYDESFYVLEGTWTVQIRDKVSEFPAGSYVLIPRGTPHGQGNFTHRPVKLLVIVAPAGFEQFYRGRAELFKTKGSNKEELEKGLEALRRKYIQIINYTWDIAKECRE